MPRVVTALVADQLERGMRVTVACPEESDLRADVVTAGARHVPWAATRAPRPRTAKETIDLARAMDKARPDLVHLHSSKAGLTGRVALRGRRPTVFQPHGWSFDMIAGATSMAAAGWERIGARWAHAIVCGSEGERQRGESAGIRAPWVVIPNGVDFARYTPAGADERSAARHRLGMPADVAVALVAGRFCREKAQDLMVSLWPEVRRRAPGSVLVLAGDGDTRATLEAAAGEGIWFVGWLSDLDQWLAVSNVVAVPSRSEAGLPLVAMEAMARGRSVVASDVSGMREGMSEGAGAVVPVDARAPLVDALVARLSDPDMADREGMVGRQRIEAQFDTHAATARMAELYGRLISAEPTRRLSRRQARMDR